MTYLTFKNSYSVMAVTTLGGPKDFFSSKELQFCENVLNFKSFVEFLIIDKMRD